jgi:hypothetical protein
VVPGPVPRPFERDLKEHPHLIVVINEQDGRHGFPHPFPSLVADNTHALCAFVAERGRGSYWRNGQEKALTTGRHKPSRGEEGVQRVFCRDASGSGRSSISDTGVVAVRL